MVLTAQLSIAGLAVLGFVGAVGTVGFSVAAPALVPALVPRESLARANGRLELARSAAYRGRSGAGRRAGGVGRAPRRRSCWPRCCRLRRVVLLLALAEPARAAAPPRHPLLEMQRRRAVRLAPRPACGRCCCAASPGTSPGSCCRRPMCRTRCARWA